MGRPPLETLAQNVSDWGYDGLELARWGDHFEVDKALQDDDYLPARRDVLAKYDLEFWAISNHLVGQATCDPIDGRHKDILPESVWGDGEPESVRLRAAEEMKRMEQAARVRRGCRQRVHRQLAVGQAVLLPAFRTGVRCVVPWRVRALRSKGTRNI